MKMMNDICLFALISAFCSFGICQKQIRIDDDQQESARLFLFPNGEIPSLNSEGCVLVSLARQQSQFNIFDYLLQFSPDHRRYSKCPTEQDLAQFNGNYLIYSIISVDFASHSLKIN